MNESIDHEPSILKISVSIFSNIGLSISWVTVEGLLLSVFRVQIRVLIVFFLLRFIKISLSFIIHTIPRRISLISLQYHYKLSFYHIVIKFFLYFLFSMKKITDDIISFRNENFDLEIEFFDVIPLYECFKL